MVRKFLGRRTSMEGVVLGRGHPLTRGVCVSFSSNDTHLPTTVSEIDLITTCPFVILLKNNYNKGHGSCYGPCITQNYL